MKKYGFKGQYSDEKILLKKHENIISFFIRKFYVVVVYLVLSVSSFYIITTFFSFLYGFISSLLFILIGFGYLFYQYLNSWMIITNRRVLKLIKSSLFIDHKRELKLVDIKATLLRRDILRILFGFGKIEIQGTDFKSNIYFEGVKPHEDILNYLSKVIDIVKEDKNKAGELTEFYNRKKKR